MNLKNILHILASLFNVQGGRLTGSLDFSRDWIGLGQAQSGDMSLNFQCQQLSLVELSLAQATVGKRHRNQLPSQLDSLNQQSFMKKRPQQFAEPLLLRELETQQPLSNRIFVTQDAVTFVQMPGWKILAG